MSDLPPQIDLADQITKRLLTNAEGEKGEALVLMRDLNRPLIRRNETAVLAQVLEAIQASGLKLVKETDV